MPPVNKPVAKNRLSNLLTRWLPKGTQGRRIIVSRKNYWFRGYGIKAGREIETVTMEMEETVDPNYSGGS